jgi:hypothetical protein
MYAKPQLQRFGNLRELTRSGWENRTGDGFWAFSMDSQLFIEQPGGGGEGGPYLS